MRVRAGRDAGRRAAGAAGARRPAPPASAPRLPLWKQPALWAALAAVLLYLPALRYGFVWDDHGLIEHNLLMRESASLPRLLLSDFWNGSDLATGYWRPLISLSYWLDMRLFHGAPAGFHAMNIMAHAATSALAALVAAEVGLAPLAALLAGLWFALLPAHVESVAFVSGRTDLYGSAFFLLAFWLDRRARRAGQRWAGWGSLAALTLALLSKESAIAFLPLVAIAEWVGIGGRRASVQAALRWVAPAAVLAAVYLAVHAALVPFSGLRMHVEVAEARQAAWGMWLELPGHLAFLWPWVNHAPGPLIRLPSGPFEPGVVAGVLVQVAFVAALATLIARRSPLAMPVALVWLPFLPLTWAGLAHGRILFAERFVYLPSAGVAWLLAAGLDALLRLPSNREARGAADWRKLGGAVVAGVLVVASAVRSVQALPNWRDDHAVFGSMVAERPQNAVGHAVLGKLLISENKPEEAAVQVGEARRLDPNLVLVDMVEAAVELFNARWDRALTLADRALARDSTMEDCQLIRGKALMEMGRMDEAVAVLEPLVQRYGDEPGFSIIWGPCLLLRGRAAEALPYLERAAGDPTTGSFAQHHYQLGLARAQLGRMREARDAFARAVQLDPGHYDAWLRLALASVVLGDAARGDTALARAAAMPQAANGAVERMRRQIATLRRGAPP